MFPSSTRHKPPLQNRSSVSSDHKPRPLSSRFFAGDTRDLARRLLGKRLVSMIDGKRASGIIVETESYLAAGDSACHAARGVTRRNEIMLAKPGMAYVYSIHAKYCFNVVAERAGRAAAVLIRAIEPHEGIEHMSFRRGTERRLDLARGPGRLCQALGICREHNGIDLAAGDLLWIESARGFRLASCQILTTRRIGVTSAHDLLLRYAIADNPFVSGPRSWR